ncbi:MAG: hypothetical protein ACO1N9_01395 [Flavobacterium sp.]
MLAKLFASVRSPSSQKPAVSLQQEKTKSLPGGRRGIFNHWPKFRPAGTRGLVRYRLKIVGRFSTVAITVKNSILKFFFTVFIFGYPTLRIYKTS